MNHKGVYLAVFAIFLVLPFGKAGEFYKTEDGTPLYIESELKFNWDQANEECAQRKMALVTVNSESRKLQLQPVIESLKLTDHLGFWMGAHKNEAGDSFEWVNNHQLFDYTNWQAGEPNNALQLEHCGMFYTGTLKWNDFICSRYLGFICEGKPNASEEEEEEDLEPEALIKDDYFSSKLQDELNAVVEATAALKSKYLLVSGMIATDTLASKLENPLRKVIEELNSILQEQNVDELQEEQKSKQTLEMQLRLYQKELQQLKETRDRRLRKTQYELYSLSKLYEKMDKELDKKDEEIQTLRQNHDQQMMEQQTDLKTLKRIVQEQSLQLQQHDNILKSSLTAACDCESNDILNEINEDLNNVQRKQNQLYSLLKKPSRVPEQMSMNDMSEDSYMSNSIYSPFPSNYVKINQDKLKAMKRTKDMLANPLYTIVMNYYDGQNQPFRQL
uniref:C-type lectin domain-containing protein n=1 Tax=Stomoxys calcitrans TaxID=35570 RepID=A0A1I8PAX9_STOCA